MWSHSQELDLMIIVINSGINSFLHWIHLNLIIQLNNFILGALDNQILRLAQAS